MTRFLLAALAALWSTLALAQNPGILPPASATTGNCVEFGTSRFRAADAGFPCTLASQAQAQAGTSNVVLMTPLRSEEHSDAWLNTGLNQTGLATTPHTPSLQVAGHETANYLATDLTDTNTGTRASQIIQMITTGSGGNGYGFLDVPLIIEARKRSFATSTDRGAVNGLNIWAFQNQSRDDVAGIVADVRAYNSDASPSGGILAFEAASTKYDAAGTQVNQQHPSLGRHFSSAADGIYSRREAGFSAENWGPQNALAAYVAFGSDVSPATYTYDWLMLAGQTRLEADIYFGITGLGRVLADNGSTTNAAYSTWGDVNTGFAFPAADMVSIVNGGAESGRWDTAGALMGGVTAALTIGSGTSDGWTLHKNGTFNISRDASVAMQLRRRSSDGSIVTFNRDTTTVGSISVTTTNTAFNTSSDERLKTNARPIEDIRAIIDAGEPIEFDWKAEPGHTSAGFIAQDFAAVVPDAVTPGEGEEIWQMDYSKLTPYLWASQQEAYRRIDEMSAQIEELSARIEALEAGR